MNVCQMASPVAGEMATKPVLVEWCLQASSKASALIRFYEMELLFVAGFQLAMDLKLAAFRATEQRASSDDDGDAAIGGSGAAADHPRLIALKTYWLVSESWEDAYVTLAPRCLAK